MHLGEHLAFTGTKWVKSTPLTRKLRPTKHGGLKCFADRPPKFSYKSLFLLVSQKESPSCPSSVASSFISAESMFGMLRLSGDSRCFKATRGFERTVITEDRIKQAVKGKSPKEIKGVRSGEAPFHGQLQGGASPAAPPPQGKPPVAPLTLPQPWPQWDLEKDQKACTTTCWLEENSKKADSSAAPHPHPFSPKEPSVPRN